MSLIYKNFAIKFFGILMVSFIGNVALAVPGVPQAPTVIWKEDFQNLPVPNASMGGIDLLTYLGASPAGQMYTADPAWRMSSNHCNGIVTAFDMNPSSSASISACAGNTVAWRGTQQFAQALGMLRGQDPATTAKSNYAVSAYTEGANPGVGGVIFRTINNIPLSIANRFLITSIDTAATSCVTNPATLAFSLISQSNVELPISTATVSVCAGSTIVNVNDPAGGSGTAINRVKTSVSPAAIGFSGSSVGYIVRNQQGSGTGNDFAFDNPTILDASPQLDKSFSPATVPLGNTSNIQFTITNTNDLLAKNGWSFTDTLSSGLTVAGNATTTCPLGISIIAPVGGNSITVTGNLDSGMASCTVTVAVLANAANTFTNNETNITSSFLTPPQPNTTNQLVVTPSADMQATGTTLPSTVIAGQTVTGTITCTNAGPSAAADATCTIPGLPAGSTVVCTPSSPTVSPLPKSGVISCQVSYVAPGTGAVSATLTAGSSTPDPVPTNNTQPYSATITPSADMQATGTTLPGTVTAGQTVTGTISCSNAGPSIAADATCTIPGLPAGATVVCTPSSPTLSPLPVFGVISCEVSYIAPTTGSIAATVTAASSTLDTVPSNNTQPYSATITPSADMQVTENTLPTTFSAGQTITGTVTCTNAGPSEAVAASCSISGLPVGATVICNPSSPTATPLGTTNSMTCAVSYVAPDSGFVNATITAGSSTSDPLPSNNTQPYAASSKLLTIAPVPTLSQWTLMILSFVLAGFAVRGSRRFRAH
ncbi:IPTL-CTERM sorting domain-containing protein [Ottowia thiooxydans]|uniref:IPTL-CTERM protein sorting domain-containing protein n=1 Tax=Ottowia thiooxydans TaxID=219182 RepID=A0ABV2Q789_9BURK